MLLVVLLFSHPVMSDSLWPHELQHARTHCSSPSPGICPSSCSLPWWCHPASSSSEALFSFCPQSSPESGTFPMSCLFASDGQNTGASGSASVLLVNIQGWSPLRLTMWSPCCPRDSQELSPAPQSESINSLAFCLLYSPALTTVHGHWEDHNLDYTDFCQQSNVSTFQHTVEVCPCFPTKKKSSSDFMAAVTICSEFGAQEEEIWKYFHHFPSIHHSVRGQWNTEREYTTTHQQKIELKIYWVGPCKT